MQTKPKIMGLDGTEEKGRIGNGRDDGKQRDDGEQGNIGG